MSFKLFNSRFFVTLVIITALAFIGLLLNWSQTNMNSAVVGTSLNEMNQVGKQMQLLLKKTSDEAEEDLSYLAKYIVDHEIPKDQVQTFLVTQSQSEKFESLFYVDIDGVGVSRSGKIRDFTNNASFLFALKNELLIGNPIINFEQDEIIFDIDIPVTENNQIIAVLLAQTSMSSFFDLMRSNSTKIEDIFILDQNLNLIYSTSEMTGNAVDIIPNNVAQIEEQNILESKQAIFEGKSGGFNYEYNGIEKVVTFFPIENSQWSLAMTMELEAKNSILTLAVKNFNRIANIVYWSVVLLVLYISINHIQSNKKLIKTAYYDSLTGLPNLTKLKLEMASVLANNSNMEYAILKFDIENFKVINDMYGFNIGDRLLKGIKTWSETLEDPTLIAARISADEFMIFAKNETLEDVKKLDELTLEHYNKIIPEIANHHITFKTGRYHIENGEKNIDEIFNKVNLAHKIAKNTKGMLSCNYDESFKKQSLKEAEIINKMKAALANNEFKVFLQPKIDVYEKKLIGAEALIRWIEDDGSMIYPDEFIPLFERNGFIVEIDRFVLENACKTIRSWMDKGYGQFTISVNCSRLNLDNPFFVDGVVAIADKYNVPHECIEIELTESTTIESELTIEDLFDSLRANNFKISIDDFGAGYSSLGMLKNLNVDTLKMDRSFFVEGKSPRRDDMLIDSIIKMAHNLGMYVVAEGIETHEQVEFLKSLNCDAIQGYVHAKPMAIPKFEDDYSQTMRENAAVDKEEIKLIHEINDAKFANAFVPCGILIAEIDEHFPITEANQGFFDLIGYTREEVREIYKNRGFETLHPDDRESATNYLMEQISSNPNGTYEYNCRLVHKYYDYIMVRFNGKVAMNEMGKIRVYMTLTDISDFAKADIALQNMKDFEANIASLMNDAFFEYGFQNKRMRFSAHFAKKFKLPEVIENFLESRHKEQLFPHLQHIFSSENGSQLKFDGQFCAMLPNGNPIWYLYNCSIIKDETGKANKLIAKLTEAVGHNLEMDILRVKSEADPLTNVYNKQATERFIRSYLRIATPNDNKGAFLVISIDNFAKVNETFGQEYGDECLKDIAKLLRNLSRSSDIIGRTDADEFFIFIGNYKEIQFVEKKAKELCTELHRKFEKDDKSVEVTASIGISLYPKHGENYNSVYEKANMALQQVKKDENGGYLIYEG